MRREDREIGLGHGSAPMRLARILGLLLLTLALVAPLAAEDMVGLRGRTSLSETKPQPPIANDINNDKRMTRNYPEQPPVIPHTIRGYEISLNANRCLTCHGRQFTAESQAPMISITHFMDRDDQI